MINCQTYNFVLLLLLVLSECMFSQEVVGEPNQYESTWRNLQVVRDILNNQDNSNSIDFKDIKGSPYYNHQFKKSKFFVGNKLFGVFNLRYNIYSDEIEVIDDNQLKNIGTNKLDLKAFLRLDNSKAIIDGQVIELYNYKDDKSIISKGYFIELNKNKKYTLLQRKRCVLTPAKKAPTFNQASRAAKFNIYNDYYLLTSGDRYPKKIQLKKNSILEMFPDKKYLLKTYIKNKKLKIKKSEDLADIINYAFSLYK